MTRSISFEGSGARLRELRRHLGRSRGEMARRLGISRQAYDKNENGQTFPRKATLEILVNEYDLSMDWLISGRGPMFYNREKQRVESLEKELAALKSEHEKLLAREQERAVKLEREMAGKIVVDDRPGLRELLAGMERVPLLYFQVMTHFQEFKMKHRSVEAERTGTVEDRGR